MQKNLKKIQINSVFIKNKWTGLFEVNNLRKPNLVIFEKKSYKNLNFGTFWKKYYKY